MDNDDIRKVLSAPGVIALVMAAVRFMLTGNKESPWLVLGYLIGAGYIAFLAGPYMELRGYKTEEIALASAAIGFAIPNLLMGVVTLARQFKDDPVGLLIKLLQGLRKK